MKKIATILVAAITLGAAALLTLSSADARWVGYGGWRHGWGWGYPGWGLAPFAAGAVIGGALAAPYYYYPYGPYPYTYYYYYPYAPYPTYNYYYGYRPGCCW